MSSERTAIVTGGTSGLGNSLVRVFLDSGWNVATFGRRSLPLEKLSLDYGNERLMVMTCDIRMDNHVAEFIRRVSERWGNVDAVVLNAGTLGPVPLPMISELSLMDLRGAMETNFFTNFNFLVESMAIMKGRSVAVHITSDAALESYPGWGAYASSKIAMDKIMSTLGNETGEDGKRFMSFDPGDMNTDMHRMALPEDDPNGLKNPRESATELVSLIEKTLLGGNKDGLE